MFRYLRKNCQFVVECPRYYIVILCHSMPYYSKFAYHVTGKLYVIGNFYCRITGGCSDLGMAMDGYGYDDTGMGRGGQGKV